MLRQNILRRGFTLVELLVVIAIIGSLVALLLPAIQMAREAARRSRVNNLKQIGVAVQTFHDAQLQYPSGRERVDEFSASWAFRLLPFMEEDAIFKSRVPKEPAESAANATAMRTPVPIFYCPSRRNPNADRDFTHGFRPSGVQSAAAGGDYAANAGSTSPKYGIDEDSKPLPAIDPTVAGPIFTFSQINARRVADGLTKTLAVGERHVPPPSPDKSPELVQIFQGDTAFFAGDFPYTIFRTCKDGFPSSSDDPSFEKFGSEHVGLCNFVLLDGHVVPIRSDIDITTLHRLSAIADGEVIAESLL